MTKEAAIVLKMIFQEDMRTFIKSNCERIFLLEKFKAAIF